MKLQKNAALHVENVVRSMLSYPNETSKECIQFLNVYHNLELEN
jgi:ribosomal protein L13